MTGLVLQVSVSTGGIPNREILAGKLTPSGITGDSWRYPFHGGPKQAVLLITIEGIRELIAQGFPLYPGALGENLTTQQIDRRRLRFGQRLRVGSATIELTKMRQPCATLNPYRTGIQAAMYDARVAKGDVESPLWGLSGFYATVVEPGIVRPGDAIIVVEGVQPAAAGRLRLPAAGRIRDHIDSARNSERKLLIGDSFIRRLQPSLRRDARDRLPCRLQRFDVSKRCWSASRRRRRISVSIARRRAGSSCRSRAAGGQTGGALTGVGCGSAGRPSGVTATRRKARCCPSSRSIVSRRFWTR